MTLRGHWAPLSCEKCTERSFVGMNGPNIYWAAAVLILGLIASYPSSVSTHLVSSLSPFVLAVVRLEIWAVSMLVAAGLVAFRSPLRKLDASVLADRRVTMWTKIWAFPLRTLVFVACGAYLYYLYLGMQHVL